MDSLIEFFLEHKYSFIFSWAIIGLIAASIAKKKHRNPYLWFLAGVCTGVFGLFLIYFAPDGDKEGEQKQRLAFAAEAGSGSFSEQPRPYVSLSSVSNVQWYFLRENEEIEGPMSFFRLQELWHNGELNEKTYVWNEKLSDWQHINEVENLTRMLKG